MHYFIEAPGVAHYHSGTLTADNDIIIYVPDDLIASLCVERHRGIYVAILSERVSLIGQSIFMYAVIHLLRYHLLATILITRI